jgi:beta-lactamase regulating signal transducer with metallopeptidase domain
VWAGLMWAVLWQSTLLVGVVGLIAIQLRRSSPGVRYWLWQIVAIKLLLMPFWTAVIPLPSWAGGVLPSNPVATEPPEHVANIPIDVAVVPLSPLPEIPRKGPLPEPEPLRWKLADVTWQSWLLVGWLTIVLWQVVRLLWQRLRLGHLLRRSTPADPELAAMVRDLAAELGLCREPIASLVDADCPMFVCGLRRPVLVLPAGLAASLNRDRLRQALFHELAHVKRLDLLWGWTIEIARMVYFFHPLVHWVSYRMRLERELACDQLAMALSGGSPAEYTDMLIEVVGHASQPVVLRTARAVSADLDGKASSLRQADRTCPKNP